MPEQQPASQVGDDGGLVKEFEADLATMSQQELQQLEWRTRLLAYPGRQRLMDDLLAHYTQAQWEALTGPAGEGPGHHNIYMTVGLLLTLPWAQRRALLRTLGVTVYIHRTARKGPQHGREAERITVDLFPPALNGQWGVRVQDGQGCAPGLFF